MRPHVILVVDDEPLVRLEATETLRDAGFDVLEADDAASARALLGSAPRIDLLCTDVQMPGHENGAQLALWVQAQHPFTGVVVVSGVCPIAARLPALTFLAKPYCPRELVRLVRGELAAALARRLACDGETASFPVAPRAGEGPTPDEALAPGFEATRTLAPNGTQARCATGADIRLPPKDASTQT